MKLVSLLILLGLATAIAAPPSVVVTLPDGTVLRGTLTPDVPATLPATNPAPVEPPPVVTPLPPVTPPADPNVLLVKPGESWVAAVKRAKSGQAVRLAAGEFREGLTDTSIRPNGVKIEGAGRDAAGKWLTTIRVAKGSAVVAWCWDGATISGIRFIADAPTQTGLSFWGCHRLTLDGCEVTGFTFGVTAQVAKTRRGLNNTIRGCLIHDNYNPAKRPDKLNADGSGMFASAQDGLTITNSTFDSNGWNGTANPGSERNHNLYLAGDNGPAVVSDNTFARASSHGAQVRCGGTVAGNTFLDNPIHLSYGLVNGGGPLVPGGVTGSITGNTFVGTRPLAGKPRGYAVEVSNARDVLIDGNTFAGDHTDAAGGVSVAAIKLDVCALSEDSAWKGKQIVIGKAVLTGNSVTWPGGPLWMHSRVDRSKVTSQQAWPAVDVAAVRSATRK